MSFVALNACAPTSAGAQLVVGERVLALSASESGVAIATDAGLKALDVGGGLIRSVRLSGGAGSPTRRKLALDGALAAPGLPADVDWARASDTETIDDSDDPRLADERPREEPSAGRANAVRRTRRGGAGEQIALAAGPAAAWVGLADGLWRLDLADGAFTRVASAGDTPVEQVAVSSDGNVVAYAQGRRLYRSRNGGQTFDGGWILPPRLDELVATDDGAVLGWDARAASVHVITVGPKRVHEEAESESAVLPDITAIASCGPKTLLVSQGRLLTLRVYPAGAPELADSGDSVPAGTTHLSCATGGRLAIVTAETVEESADEGRTWSQVGGAYPGAFAGMKITRRAIWVAGSAGLWTFSSRPNRGRRSGAISCGCGDASAAANRATPIGRERTRAARWLGSLLPRVDLVFAVAGVGAHRDVLGLVLLTFVLDSQAMMRTEAAGGLAVPRVQAGLSGDCLAASRVEGSGPLAAEERAAVIRVLEESP